MQTYAQYCPISRTLDIVGDRWTLLVIRELIIGSTRFNEIARGLPGLSRGLLSRRLRQLEAAGVIEKVDGAYRLTDAGARALEAEAARLAANVAGARERLRLRHQAGTA